MRLSDPDSGISGQPGPLLGLRRVYWTGKIHTTVPTRGRKKNNTSLVSHVRLFCNSCAVSLRVNLSLSSAWGGTGGEAKNVVLKDLIRELIQEWGPGFTGQSAPF